MTQALIATLPLPQRLALSYAPAAARDGVLALLALEERLAGIVRGGGEPVIAQIKLAWWRDRLGEPAASWPTGEPLLALLARWPGDSRALVALVDGWEMLLADALDLQAFAAGRAAGWAALGGGEAEVQRAAHAFALADLALHLADGDEREAARAAAQAADWQRPRLPRALRPLLVLHGLAGRTLRRGAGELLDGPGALLCAVRLGIAGR